MKLKKLSAALLALLICTQPVKAQEINRTEPVTVQNYTETVQAASAKKKKTGWVHTEKGYRYRRSDGTWVRNTWKKIDGKVYYFGSSGYMRTGWLKLNGKKYYLGKNGARRTGWHEIKGKWYYFSAKGVMKTGWFKYKGRKYYCSPSGVMKTGWLQYKNKWYLFSDNGAMCTGWQEHDGKWYYLKSTGAMVSGWKQISDKWYYFSGSGAMHTGWLELQGKWYYFNKNGTMRTGWLNLDDKWYYLQENGSMVTGSVKIGSRLQRFDQNGVWQKETVIPDIVADYAYVFDVTGNEVLYAKNENQRMWPASLTKVMTVLLALENLNLSDTITVQQYMLDDLAGKGLSQAGFRAGQTLSYRDLLYGAMLPSGADACNIIAYAVSGSTDAFVDLMNRRARRLGMMNTHFANVHGNDDPNHYSTARDIEILMEAAIKHDTFLNVISTYSYTTTAGQRLISSVLKKTSGYGGEYTIPGLVGGKTGYTPDARYNLAVLTNKDGRKRIFVVAHSWVNYYPTHFRDISLLAKAFNE